ncbi:MAG: hypothetical protein EOO33_14725 [Comamonadaceae bacterium]|nr:MAG: hypothetical protein EOO33_14725 [Comamonadaceae bacterium]
MSQNTHTLHLLFEDRLRLRLAQLVFQYLGDGGTQEASRWAAEWNGADPAALWNADWFNAEVHAPAGHLIVRFDAGKHDALPLQALEHMVERGLSAAVLRGAGTG